jgi:glycosyltransferase involved in cell wall biosynthesis
LLIHPAFAGLPALTAGCRLTVAIPARNEAELLGTALAALAAQQPLASGPPVRGTYDAIVFVNNSSDATVEVARAFAAAHPEFPLTDACADLPRAVAHVGTARKLVMDAAAARFAAGRRPGGLVATTDADTLVAPDWIAQTYRAAADADAIASHVALGEEQIAALLAPVRLLYSRERSYRRAVAEIEDLIDPQPHDRFPRHASVVGAGFAVTAAAYAAAGGVPPLAALEDLAFSHALVRIDARIRHSTLVRATTSDRRIARAPGGFGTFLADLDARGSAGETFFVDHPRKTLDAFESRAALRRIWNRGGDAFDRATVSRIFASDERDWLPLVDRSRAFGSVYESVAAASLARPAYAPVAVEVATAALRAAAHVSNALAPTRSRAASGAG